MKITIFTPTYNRGYIIEKLYQSLRCQTMHDFEWIVIDDGSTDNTSSLFSKWNNEKNFFEIIYKKVSNGGKHRAINQGVNMAKGELFFIVDSDDYLTEDALARIVEVEQSILKDEKTTFGGICGKKGYSVDKDVGTTFDGKYLDITTLERAIYGISGDKAEVFYTEILKRYPFPAFDNENFMTECVVWDRIAADGYKLRFFNDVIYICDYLQDGLTAQGKNAFIKNPKGWGLYLAQEVEFKKITGLYKWNCILEYFYALRTSHSFLEIAKYLQMNPFTLYFRLLGIRLFYKMYDQ